jgi:ectoine hydroxylase
MRDPYPSRIDQPALLCRREPVVWSRDPAAGPWRQSEVERYRHDGFLVRESLLSGDEITALRTELARLDAQRELRDRAGIVSAPRGEGLATVFDTPAVSPLLDALSCDPRLLEPARHLLDDEVYLHQSRALYAPALQRQESHWHSDFETWHIEDGMRAMRSLSVLITLGDSREYEGPLSFISGSHTRFISCTDTIPQRDSHHDHDTLVCGQPDPLFLELLEANGGSVPVRAPAGSAIFFDCNVLHAGGVGATLPESTVSFIYNAAENQLANPRFGRQPRPEYLAARNEPRLLTPRATDYGALAAQLHAA